MEIYGNAENRFETRFVEYELVGFHGTSIEAANEIESRGFLPTKVLEEGDQRGLLAIAEGLGVDVADYREWLGMRSVTFAIDYEDALKHLRSGHVGGQGLRNILSVAEHLYAMGNEVEKELATRVIARIEARQSSRGVVYAVNLTGLGPRLAQDRRLYHYYWNPEAPLPATSEIGPDRLIARLDVQ